MGPTSQRSTPDSLSCQKYLGKMKSFKTYLEEAKEIQGYMKQFIESVDHRYLV